MWLLLLLILTLTLFALPLLPALREWRRKRDTTPLAIQQEHTGDIHYFAEKFRAFIEGEIDALLTGKPTTDPAGNYSLCERGCTFTPDQDESHTRSTQRIVIALGELTLPDNLTFAREIYGRETILGGSNNLFRAILANGNLFLGERNVVLRWAHAHAVYAGADCRIQGRLSAEKRIVFETGCTFARIRAPYIRFGLDMPLDRQKNHHPLPGKSVGAGGRVLANGDLEFPRNSRFQGDIVAHGDVLIHDGAVIEGSIKAHGALRLGCNVTVDGSLVCGKHMIIAEGCLLGGPLIAEQRIDIAAGTVAGSPAALTTITAPVIRIAHGVVAHGTVWANRQGSVLPPAAIQEVSSPATPLKSAAT